MAHVCSVYSFKNIPKLPLNSFLKDSNPSSYQPWKRVISVRIIEVLLFEVKLFGKFIIGMDFIFVAFIDGILN